MEDYEIRDMKEWIGSGNLSYWSGTWERLESLGFSKNLKGDLYYLDVGNGNIMAIDVASRQLVTNLCDDLRSFCMLEPNVIGNDHTLLRMIPKKERI